MLGCGHTFCHGCLMGVQRAGGAATLKVKSTGLTQIRKLTQQFDRNSL